MATDLARLMVQPHPAAAPDVARRVALVRAQLEPIRSRAALIDSYERESLNRLADAPGSPGSEGDVLDLAYALRWRELAGEAVRGRRGPGDGVDGIDG